AIIVEHRKAEAFLGFENPMQVYMVTSNHIHLLVRDTGGQVIAQSMQLINCGTHSAREQSAQGRRGGFWENRDYATAIEADVHLHRCLVYIDLNMVRAIEY